MKTGTTCKTTKKYPRVTAGPLRHKYIHREIAAAMIGRELTKDEQVDHRDRDRRNFKYTNLVIRGEKDHGFVSSRQAYFMRSRDAKEKAEWDEFMAEQDAKQAKEIAEAKASGVPWYGKDGDLQAAWKARKKA
jgi:hypothetical protein